MSAANVEDDQNKDDNFEDQNQDKITSDRIKQLVKENFFSGVTVALVSIPLSSALAMAQGGTAMMGLETAVYGPAIGGILGGSNYNILGPAGALVNIVSTLQLQAGAEIIPMVALFGGIISFLVYLFKLENFCTMLPTSVLEGFSLGVACSIGLGQLNYAFGLVKVPKHKAFYMNVVESFKHLGETNMVEFLPFFIGFIILMSLLKWKPQHPWIIVVAILGIIYGAIMKSSAPDMAPLCLMDIYPKMKDDVQLFNFDFWSPKKAIPFALILVGSFKVSFVAVLETLISGRIADNKTNTRFDQSKEIFGMSIANIFCGLMGGTPCTGVLIRTNVNIQTKATHKTSQFINAMTVFFIILLAGPVFTYLPMCIIASILITSSCRLVPMTVMKQLWQCDRSEFFLLIITWLLCVFFDGAAGLLIGSFLSFLKLSKLTSEAQMFVNNVEDYQSNGDKKTIMSVELEGSLNYINTVHFETQILDKVNDESPDYVVINLNNVRFVDIDGLISLDKVFKRKKEEIALVVKEYDENSVLAKSWWFQSVKEQNYIFTSLEEAKDALFKNSGGKNLLQ